MISASFFWQNDKPVGLGFTFAYPSFTESELQAMFASGIVKQYMLASDLALGTGLVNTYLAQLQAIAQDKLSGQQVPFQKVVLACFNIMWLTDRGFIPNDRFNGYQFVKAF